MQLHTFQKMHQFEKQTSLQYHEIYSISILKDNIFSMEIKTKTIAMNQYANLRIPYIKGADETVSRIDEMQLGTQFIQFN